MILFCFLQVKLIPNLEVYAQLPRPEGVREGSMTYTAWKCSIGNHDSLPLKLCTLPILFYLTLFKKFAENSSKEAEDRVSFLAIAWDRRVQVAKLVKSKLKECAKWSLDSVAIGVVWLDDQVCIRI